MPSKALMNYISSFEWHSLYNFHLLLIYGNSLKLKMYNKIILFSIEISSLKISTFRIINLQHPKMNSQSQSSSSFLTPLLAISNEFTNIGPISIAIKQLTLILLILILVLMARIAFKAKYRPSTLRFSPLAPSILVYLYFHIFGAAISIPYNVYQIYAFYWANNAVDQHAEFHYNMIYWTGQWQNTYNAISPLPVLFLTIERCITLRMPGGLGRKELLEKWLLRLSALIILASFVGSTGFYLAELPLNLSHLISLGCETVSCQMLYFRNLPQLFFKAILSFANIFSCIIFLYTLRSYGIGAKQIRNRSVIITICFESIFNILPTFVTLAFNFFGQAPISNIISLTSALDAFCCAIYYSFLFLPNRIFKVNSTNRVDQQKQQNKNQINISPISQTPIKDNDAISIQMKQLKIDRQRAATAKCQIPIDRRKM